VCSGQTRPESIITEAQSYLTLATSAGLFHPPAPFLRATTEDYALDSFQNLLFSIARFHEYTGNYPAEITVIGFAFKRLRFLDLHRAALRWPIRQFHYIGVDPGDGHHLTAAQGEVSRLYYRLIVCFKRFSARIRLSALFRRSIWVPFRAACEETTQKFVHPVPLVLYLVSGAAAITRLVSKH
jgi:hypothetical protein